MRLTAALALTVAVTLVLAACTPEGETARGATRGIDDLPSGARFLAVDGRPEPFDGSVEELLSHLPFEPLYPAYVPGNRSLTRATVYPSAFAPDSHAGATLMLDYRREDNREDWFQITQRSLSMPDVSGVETEPVFIGEEEGVLLEYPGGAARELVWRYCDRTLTLMSPILEVEELLAIAESMMVDCS